MNTYGERVKVTIFGESHGPAIGVVLDGVPAGEAVDMDAVRIQMRRRAPGSSDLTTHRSETDDPLVMSGILNGVTTGAPISAIFRNKDQNSAAYHPEIPRPSHADYAATVRFGGHADLRGGGPFSGRLTACLVFAGAVCRQILERRGITITANAVRVGQATGRELNFDMKRAILDARSAGDSVGSELECVVTGVPAGVGGLLFGGMESRIAGMLYAIPGVKGVEFGRGFALAEMRGSEANDPIRLQNGRITMASNNAGGHQRRHHQRHAARRAHGPAADAVDRLRAAVGRPRDHGGNAAAYQRPARPVPCPARDPRHGGRARLLRARRHARQRRHDLRKEPIMDEHKTPEEIINDNAAPDAPETDAPEAPAPAEKKPMSVRARHALRRGVAGLLAAIVLLAVSGFGVFRIAHGAQEIAGTFDADPGTFVQHDIVFILNTFSDPNGGSAQYGVVPIGGKLVAFRFPARWNASVKTIADATTSVLSGQSYSVDSFIRRHRYGQDHAGCRLVRALRLVHGKPRLPAADRRDRRQ